MVSATPSEVSDFSMGDGESFTDVDHAEFFTSPPSNSTSSPIVETIGSPVSADQKLEPREHPQYFFDDGSVVFLVKGMKYRLHRYLFSRDSAYWADKFKDNPTEDPFRFDDKEPSDFDAFLSVLYAPYYRPLNVKSAGEWSAVLRLATEWSFDGIRNLALERLGPIVSPIERIALSREYSVPQWRPPAYVSLCQRPNSLTAAEIKAIDAEDAELIMSVRETILRAGLPLEVTEVSAQVNNALKLSADSGSALHLDPTSANVLDETDVQRGPEKKAQTPGVDLRLDTASLLCLFSIDYTRDVASCISPQIPRSLVHTEVSALLEGLTSGNIDATAQKIIQWINLAKGEEDCATLSQVVGLVHAKATSDWTSGSLCAPLCRQVMDKASSKIRGPGVRECAGQILTGGQLFRNRLLGKCLGEFDQICSHIKASPGAPNEPHVAEDSDALDIFIPESGREDMVARFVGELATARVLYSMTILHYLKTLDPDDRAQELNEKQVRLICMLLSSARACLKACGSKIHARYSWHISSLQNTNPARLSESTARIVNDLLQLESRPS